MIRNGIGEISPLSILNLVDDLQRLGVSYYFVNEISNVLENVYNNYYKNHEDWIKMDLNLKSLGFRLLRQHGYHIPQEIFKDVIDENGNVNGPFYEDVVGMLNLYEASYHSVEDESILDDARIFTEKYLKEIIEKMSDKNMLSLISHALAFPLHWIPPRVESMWFIEMYETRLIGMNPEVLEFAKLDYNMGQAVHQEDLKYVSRGDLTKVNAMITTIVDVYDVYGTLQELEQFTNVMNSWDANAIKELPHYMQICFLAFSNAINEMSYNVLANESVFILPYFQKAWQDLSHSYIIEARWFSSGYTPTFEEFVNNAYMSIGIMPIIKHAYVLSLTSVSEDALKRIGRAENMMRSASLIVRLTNDMGTSSDELERGDVPKSIQCYMLESGATEVEAREYIKKLIMETWKKMNKERQAIVSEFPREFLDCVTNLARMGHFMYTDGDKHGDDPNPTYFPPCDGGNPSGLDSFSAIFFATKPLFSLSSVLSNTLVRKKGNCDRFATKNAIANTQFFSSDTSSSSAPPNGSDPAAAAPPDVSENRNSDPNPLDCCKAYRRFFLHFRCTKRNTITLNTKPY
ncbi:hypothetical protein L1987_81648 [Smallanthus sonchifolius]|uniref:Uncharacterized protein n=1 Tax=Smallanthus sonchifolius TaxID=185202 RepID=A0ACB8YR81_9ASTR|nr:hypothetical protein L1987_81648 [Smallanthus sonchifolius]